MMFEYHLSDEFGLKCLHLKGRIESMSASAIQGEVNELILSGERRFIIDFEEVNYISSSGLRVFLAAQKQLGKAGGEIILFKIPPDVLRVFRMSGLEQLFRIASSEEEIQSALRAEKPSVEVSSGEIQGIRVQFLKRDVGAGDFFTIGSQKNLATSNYTENDVKAVKPENIQFGTGLAAIGDRYGDYKDFFGEAVVINRHLYFYPAAKRSAVDFMLYTQEDSGLEYKFLYGFGFKGDYKYILSFESPETFTELSLLMEGLFDLSETNIFGVVFMAESRGLWGMNLKRVPLTENKPKSGKSIFDSVNFSEWMNFPVEPSDLNNIVIGTGIAVKDRNALSTGTKQLIPRDQNFHLHACVFEKQPFNNNLQEFEEEMKRVLTELEVYKVQHILGQTWFSSGIVGLIELKE
jgi:anti-anti-sigma factor